MKVKYNLIILLIIITFDNCQEEDNSILCQQCFQQQAFLRGYIIQNECYIINSQVGDQLIINYKSYKQNLPVIWNSDGLVSESTFCLFQLSQNQLTIKIFLKEGGQENLFSGILFINNRTLKSAYFFIKNIIKLSSYKDNFLFYFQIFIKIVNLFLKQYFNFFNSSNANFSFYFNQLYTAREIKHASTNDDKYSFYFTDMEGNYIYFFFDQTNKISYMLTRVPKIMSLDIFTSIDNKCIYQLIRVRSRIVEQLLFCVKEDLEEIKDIQYSGNEQIVVDTDLNTYVIENNIISYIQPSADIYLIKKTNPYIVDLSEYNTVETDLPKFNNNYELEYNKFLLMSYRDPYWPNSQKIQSIYKLNIRDTLNLQKYQEQTDNVKLYLNNYQLYRSIQLSQINDQDNEFTYIQFNTTSSFSRYLSNGSIKTKILLMISITALVTSIILFILIFRRSQVRKQLIAQIEALIFQQTTKISENEFEKKYQIDYRDSLGAGAFGEVYKAKNRHKDIIKNPDILKNMPDSYACKHIILSQEQQSQHQLVLKEIEVLEKLKHYDSVIKLQNYIVKKEQILIVLDLAESTLQEQIINKQMNNEQYTQDEIVQFLSQIGKTLGKIYSDEGIAHSDIKPSNILIKQGNYYLSDFGCAQEISQSSENRKNIVLGTLKWMSPEVREMRNNDEIDYFKSDIFSLGMILLYMLTLTDISQVNSDESNKRQKVKIMKNQCQDYINHNIILLVTKMIETNPDHRPDASILKKAIEDIELEIQQNLNQKQSIINT